MKYYSDKTSKFYATEQECVEAEKAHDEALAKAEAERKALVEQRTNRAKEVEDAYKAMMEAKKNYNKLLDAFLKDYGQFHMTFRSQDPVFSWLEGWF